MHKGRELGFKVLESGVHSKEADSKEINKVVDQICSERLKEKEIPIGPTSPCAPYAQAVEGCLCARAVDLWISPSIGHFKLAKTGHF
jgi:hypothetical protein